MLTLIFLLNVYFVSFTDKPEKSAPALSERAVEQRAKWDIATDEMDYPVSRLYTDSLRALGAKMFHTSRWFNGATVTMSDSLASVVENLSFVTDVEMTRDDSAPIYGVQKRKTRRWQIDPEQMDHWTKEQLDLYNLPPLHQQGFKGQGILMTVCDGGFYHANTLTCFRQDELELGHFDFTDDTDDFYGSTGTHGTECLSTISGIMTGYYGAAPESQYYLMRSEEAIPESPKEMDNLVAALETADSLGVNVFSVSLGYAYFDHLEWTIQKSELDGKSTRCSRAATIAARKGMLVCVAAGNEGNSEWHSIDVPADADSILTVGAVGVDSIIGYFSSYGPSADGRIKPEVCAVGVQTTLINPSGTIVRANGTSFATPLIAGMAAALWSALPEENAMQIRERIIRSADRYEHPDKYQYGYGIPDALKALQMNQSEGLQIENEKETVKASKVLRDGQMLIIRYGHVYNLSGQLIE